MSQCFRQPLFQWRDTISQIPDGLSAGIDPVVLEYFHHSRGDPRSMPEESSARDLDCAHRLPGPYGQMSYWVIDLRGPCQQPETLIEGAVVTAQHVLLARFRT